MLISTSCALDGVMLLQYDALLGTSCDAEGAYPL